MRLAIIEDSSTMGRLWGHWLEGSGHTFTLFDSGPESLEVAATQEADVYICTGVPAHASPARVREVLGDALRRRALVLATSSDQAHLGSSWNLGELAGVLVKPFAQDAVLALLRKLHLEQLNRSRARPLAVVVDDSKVATTVLGRMLEALGFEVRVAPDGVAGLELIRALLPNLAVVDVEMPGLDGWGLCEALSFDATTRDIPVVLNSATVNEQVERRGFLAGTVDFLPKPVDSAALATVVRRRLGTSAPAHQTTALILEDEPISATISRRMLAELGVAAHVCATVAELRAHLGIGRPGLLLLDEQVPDGLGSQVCRELRGRGDYDGVPIIGMSASLEPNDRRVCLQAGADDFLEKPFTRDEFRVRVAGLVATVAGHPAG